MKSFTLSGLFGKPALSTRNRRSAKPRHKRPLASRLRFEPLEERTLLAAGDFDVTFGIGGTTPDFQIQGRQYTSESAVVMADGRFVLGGVTALTGTESGHDFAAARYNPDGSLDPSFGNSGAQVVSFGLALSNLDFIGGFGLLPGTSSPIEMAVQSDGAVVVVGHSMSKDLLAARLTPSGQLDDSFGNQGVVTIANNELRNLDLVNFVPVDIAVQSDGSVVIAGSGRVDLPESNGATDYVTLRLTVDGQIDPSFGDGGLGWIAFDHDGSSYDFATDMVLQPDGKILLAGVHTTDYVVAPLYFALARLNSDGSPDYTFGGDSGKLIIDAGTVSLTETFVALQPDGMITLLASVSRDWLDSFPLPEVIVARITPNGQLDTSFGTGGLQTTGLSYARDAAFQVDGSILVGDYFTISRLTPSGLLDTSFGDGGTIPVHGRRLTLQTDGKLLVPWNGFTVRRLLGHDASIEGTEAADTIIIEPGTEAGTLKATVNGSVADNLTFNGLLLVDGLGGDDTFTVTASLPRALILAGRNGSDTYDISFGNLAGTVSVADDGASGADELIIRGTPGDDEIFKDDTKVTLGNPVQETVLTIGIESRTIHGEEGNDTITDPGSETFLFGDAGNDTIIINATSGSGVTADGGAGSDHYVVVSGSLAGPVNITDSGAAGDDDVTVLGTPGDDTLVQTDAGFTLNGAEIIFGAGLETATVDGGGGSDQRVVEGTPPIPEVHISWIAEVRQVAVDIHAESLNVDSNGTLSVVIFGAVDFNAAQIDVGSVRFAGAMAWQYNLIDVNGDGRLDLQLKFRRQDTILDQIYAQLLLDDSDADGVLDSTRQVAEVAVTGQTLDDVLFSGADDINLFLSGRALRELLDDLFA